MIGMLIIQSIWDWRFRRIPLVVTLIGAGMGCMWSVMQQREWHSLLLGLIPGVVCLIIGKITREAIGYGDGFLLCAMGCYLPIARVMEILLSATFLAGIVGLYLMAVRKKHRREEMPFVPFLLLGALLCWLGQGGMFYA